MYKLREFFLLLLISKISARCSDDCSCFLDNRGRNTVLCNGGGLIGPINLENISSETEVLKITAPEDNMNWLIMSPVFRQYKNLEEIHITRSNIPQLGMHFFYGLKKLDVLNLSQNNITQPLDHNFRGLDKLKELYLDDNRINSLPSGTFRYLRELQLLSIQRNRISELTPRIFLDVRTLKVLKLSGNHLNELNVEVFKDVQNLENLECRKCALRNVNSHIYHLLPQLSSLDLGENELTYILADEFQELKNLKALQLDGNQLNKITDENFRHQFDLVSLNLARNNINQISINAFANLSNLTDLDLSYNKLEFLDQDVIEILANNLRRLELSGNYLKLRNLKDILKNLHQLDELHLQDCGIYDIQTKMFPENISILNLSGNRLSTLGSEIIPNNLFTLDISTNRLRGLDSEILLKLDYIRNLRLDNNPWFCDLCFIVPMLERVNTSKIFQNVICHQPTRFRGIRLGQIQKAELGWCSMSTLNSGDANYYLGNNDTNMALVAVSTTASLLLITLIFIIGAFLYNRRHAAKYYTHEDKLSKDDDALFETHSPLFCDDRELSFKFPIDIEKRISVATIDEIKKGHTIENGT